VNARIRYNHAGASATIAPRPDGGVEVRFDEPQLAVTPGQLAVFYVGDRCLGGAAIREALASPGRQATAGLAATAGVDR
jgi:tRNA-specific 2-thiouridylase